VAKRYAEFPIILETYRECLRDVLDVPGLTTLLRGLHSRELSLVEVETPTASPFASSLLFDYVATYMYEGDTPNAERRAAALSLDRDLLRELLGQEELRDLIDPDALEQVEDDLQHRSEPHARDVQDASADVLRRVGDLTVAEAAARMAEALDAEAVLLELAAERRAVRVRMAGEERWIAADDIGLYRDALGVVPPGGLPEAFQARVPRRARQARAALRRHPRPFTTDELRERYRVDPSAPLEALERAGDLVRGELRPGRHGARMVRHRGPAPPARALARGAAQGDRGGRSSARWPRSCRLDGDRPPPRRGRGGSTGCARCSCRCRASRCPSEVWERDVLPRRCGAYSPVWLDQLCASGEVVWVGAGAIGRSTGRSRCTSATTPRRSVPRPRGSSAGPARARRLRERLALSPCFFTDLLAELAMGPEQLQEALWDLVWAAR
jgi:ATP-dependent Lhr-like helicase